MPDLLDVVIASPGLPHDGMTLQQKSLGGSETATIHFARALANRGHHVTVFSHCQGGQFGSPPVFYMPLEQFVPYVSAMPHDVTVICRDLQLLRFRYNSKMTTLWCHDLALKRTRPMIAGALWFLDAIAVMSEFQKQHFLSIYEGLPPEVIQVTRNGIDLAAITALGDPPRDRTKLVFGSRPERGLEAALNVMDELRRRGSPLTLSVAGYDNTTEQMKPYYDALHARARTMPNVKLLGSLRQQDWHREIATALALIYPGCPGEFREISCIVAMEAMACGTPVVTIGKGAVPETLGAQRTEATEGGIILPDDVWTCHTGIIVGDEATEPHEPKHTVAFADAILRLVNDEVLWKRCSRQGRTRAQGYDWAAVGADWEERWLSRLRDRSSNPYRVRRHLERMGEHEALSAMVA